MSNSFILFTTTLGLRGLRHYTTNRTNMTPSSSSLIPSSSPTPEPEHEFPKYFALGGSIFCICFAALAAGLTLGVMGLDEDDLQQLQHLQEEDEDDLEQRQIIINQKISTIIKALIMPLI